MEVDIGTRAQRTVQGEPVRHVKRSGEHGGLAFAVIVGTR